MSYLDKTLLPNEKLIYRCHPHWVIFFKPTASLLAAMVILYWGLQLVAAIFALVTLIGYFSVLIVYFTSEFGITDHRIIIKLGFIRRYSFENALDRIEGVAVDQTILGRLLNYGSIRIHGVGGTVELFPAVPNPLLFRYKVQEQIARQNLVKKSI